MRKSNAPKQTSPASRGKKAASILSIAAFILLLAVLTVFVGGPLIRSLNDPAVFREWVVARGFWGRVLFVGMMILQVVVAFIPGEPLEIAAGYAFGAFWGTLLAWIGLVLGSTIVFLFVRKIGIKAVEVFFPREKINSLKYLKDEKTLGVTAFFLFLIPGTPKDLLTYFAGLTKIRLLPWIVLTSIARIPSIVTSTIGGNARHTAVHFCNHRLCRDGAAQRRRHAGLSCRAKKARAPRGRGRPCAAASYGISHLRKRLSQRRPLSTLLLSAYQITRLLAA
jgi:uncharacterized membrane protein YdjX (TVP38/TMEM64 family)